MYRQAEAHTSVQTIAQFVAHYHEEGNHQGLGNELIDAAPPVDGGRRIRCRERLGGLLNYYARAAWMTRDD